MRINLGGILRAGSAAVRGRNVGRSEAMRETADRTFKQQERDDRERAREQQIRLDQARVSNEELRARAILDSATDPEDLDSFEKKEEIRAKVKQKYDRPPVYKQTLEEKRIEYYQGLLKKGMDPAEAKRRMEEMYPLKPTIDFSSLLFPGGAAGSSPP